MIATLPVFLQILSGTTLFIGSTVA
uniref:Uncharacterized protein n=1 Tax=Rhizophora mucronata TaxID=61149 RepID=A0A2P2PMQ1_RHIMU